MPEQSWHGRPYYSLDAWCKNTYQHKCYKIALNAHMTCPNRDGSLGSRGCIFCSAGGSGDFAVELPGNTGGDIEGQLEAGIRLIAGKLPGAQERALSDAEAGSGIEDSPCIIAYFQAYTNTYAPLPYLEQVFTRALDSPLVCGISIATRPDCLPEDVLLLLENLTKRCPGKFVWVELGLQTIHEKTAAFIRRGYALPCFEEAMLRLRRIGIPVIVHVILGLPGESETQMLETVRYLNAFRPFGVKLQLLHVLEGTDLADCYRRGEFTVLSMEEYLDILIKCLESLSPDIVIHRVTGDGPKKLLIAPEWSANKRAVLNTLHGLMRERGSCQGSRM